jgi:DNA-3-methyladenine glycosylase
MPEVVLLRALEPVAGLELMEKRRKTDKLKNLCSGPGKLCQSMDIGKVQYGADCCGSGGLFVEYGGTTCQIETSKRIGIDYAVRSRDMPWRFTIAGNPFVSR